MINMPFIIRLPISSPDSAVYVCLYIKEKRENLYLLLVSRIEALACAHLVETSNADPTPICIYMTPKLHQ